MISLTHQIPSIYLWTLGEQNQSSESTSPPTPHQHRGLNLCLQVGNHLFITQTSCLPCLQYISFSIYLFNHCDHIILMCSYLQWQSARALFVCNYHYFICSIGELKSCCNGFTLCQTQKRTIKTASVLKISQVKVICPILPLGLIFAIYETHLFYPFQILQFLGLPFTVFLFL